MTQRGETTISTTSKETNQLGFERNIIDFYKLRAPFERKKFTRSDSQRSCIAKKRRIESSQLSDDAIAKCRALSTRSKMVESPAFSRSRSQFNQGRVLVNQPLRRLHIGSDVFLVQSKLEQSLYAITRWSFFSRVALKRKEIRERSNLSFIFARTIEPFCPSRWTRSIESCTRCIIVGKRDKFSRHRFLTRANQNY